MGLSKQILPLWKRTVLEVRPNLNVKERFPKGGASAWGENEGGNNGAEDVAEREKKTLGRRMGLRKGWRSVRKM